MTFNWAEIHRHEERMEELAVERLKLEVEKLRLELGLAKARLREKGQAA